MVKINKRAEVSNFIKITLVILIILLVILVGYFIFNKTDNNGNPENTIVLQNPLVGIVVANTVNGNVNQEAVIREGVLKFNETYIVYLLVAMEISDLHKSNIGYGNPKIEIILDEEDWNCELGSNFLTKKGKSDDPDIRILMSKENAVKALMSSDIKQFMKNLVSNGKVQIEMVAGKVELLSKGYLEMSKNLGYDVKL